MGTCSTLTLHFRTCSSFSFFFFFFFSSFLRDTILNFQKNAESSNFPLFWPKMKKIPASFFGSKFPSAAGNFPRSGITAIVKAMNTDHQGLSLSSLLLTIQVIYVFT
uniref:Uncharacterized protein n=1 Tax=Cacopsylla melanoneura TaxID=428564 RepID=A0A8D9EPV9_9HEMI